MKGSYFKIVAGSPWCFSYSGFMINGSSFTVFAAAALVELTVTLGAGFFALKLLEWIIALIELIELLAFIELLTALNFFLLAETDDFELPF